MTLTNNDGSVILTNTIIALQVVNGIQPTNKLYKYADVSTDEKIGIAEAIYSLQKVAGLRIISSIASWHRGLMPP